MQILHPGAPSGRPLVARPPRAEFPSTSADDCGPLLACAALLREREPLDDATRALLDEAIRRALTGASSSAG